MAYLDVAYTNGVIAAREKNLLKDKIYRLCELTAEEAFRALLESGFGGGAENAANVYEHENLIAAEEANLDGFIREYAPSETEKAYLLSPRDFHNAKALIKAASLGVSAERLLAPEGLIPLSLLSDAVENGDFQRVKELNAYLGGACEETTALLQEEPSGAKVGEIFEKALYSYLWSLAKKKPALKKLLRTKTDMTNILIALRCGDKEPAREKYLPAGTLKAEKLDELFNEDAEKSQKAFAKTEYDEFVKQCFAAREKGLPMTEAEKTLGGADVEYFSARKYELERNEPFLYYVYRRRVENANVRIVFACLLAGQGEQEIKRRLRRFL